MTLSRAARAAWARRIRKAYEVDLLLCPHCGAEMRVLSVIERIYQEPGSHEFDRFEDSQKQTRYHYQWLVLFDFLKRLCDPDVYRWAVPQLLKMDGSYPLLHKPAECLVAALVLAGSVCAAEEDSPVVTTKVEGRFGEVLHSVRMAIVGRGLNVAHTLPASGMLSRSGLAFGIQELPYESAEIIEFCSARISHRLTAANPENISLCPFTIAIYVMPSDPQHVRLTYRKPYVIDEASREATEAMVQLVEGVIEEATAW